MTTPNWFYEDLSSPENKDIFKGLVKPVRVRAQPCDSNLYLVDSKDRISGDSFNFMVDCVVPLRALDITVNSVCIPKIPNVNAVNNTFSIWTQNLGSGHTGSTGPTLMTGTLPVGFYNQTTLQTNLKVALDAAAVSAGVTDTYTVSYNTFNKTIAVTSNAGNRWYWDSSSPFIVYGHYFTGFVGAPAGSNMLTVGKITDYSGIIGLIYSRYVKIKSNRLIGNAKEKSRTSSAQTNIIAVASLVDQTIEGDYSVSNVFNGSLILCPVSNSSCHLNVAYFMKELNTIDFQLTDEYDLPLDRSMNYGDPYDNTRFDVMIWMTYIV
jgi:hypothetical protein